MLFSLLRTTGEDQDAIRVAVSTLRALGAETNVNPALIGMLNKLGEVPYIGSDR